MKGKLAKEYFLKGYNCSQAVLLAFNDKLNLDESTILKLASPFGGGIGRLRLTCGAFSSLCMVVGLIKGYDTPETGIIKMNLYQKIQNLAKDFEKANGSLQCKTLLNIKDDNVSPVPTIRDENFYNTRPCMKIIMNACDILENELKNDIKI